MTWITWLVPAGILVILEIFSGTFYLLMLALGFAAGGLMAWFGLTDTAQVIIAAITGFIATILLRKSRLGKTPRTDASRNPDVNLDIGQILQVDEWKNSQGGQYTARAMYRGALWDIDLEENAEPHPGLFKIQGVRGSRLMVINKTLSVK